MNRAILIVICDFLVSSMLSLMTGMVPAHTGGTGVGLDERTTRLLLTELEVRRQDIERLRQQLRQAAANQGQSPDSPEVRRLTGELARNIRQSSDLNRQLKATPANTGKLTPEQLKQLLDRETERRIEAEIAIKDKQTEVKVADVQLAQARELLSAARQELVKREEKLSATEKSVAETGRVLARIAGEYAKSQQQLAQFDGKLKLTERELSQTRAAVMAKESDLSGVREALREMNAKIGQVNLERQSLQNTLAFTSGKLNTTERDLADFKGQLTRLRRALAEKELETREANRKRAEMGALVKRTVTELSQAKNELEKNKTAMTAVEVKLATTEKLFKEAVKGPADNALRRYTEAAVRLTVSVVEDRLMLEHKGGGSYYLPLVKYGAQSYVVGALSTLAGDGRVPLLFNRVTRLDYQLSAPDGTESAPLRGPLLVQGGADGVGAFEAAPAGRIPLTPLDFEQLKRRGTRELYLFRQDAYGKESTALGDRCSIDLSGKTPTVIIRNAPGAVKAVPGDWVMTREGDFIGVVVDEEGSDYSRQRMVRVFVPSGSFAGATEIPVDKSSGEKYFERFGAAIRTLLKAEPGKRGK